MEMSGITTATRPNNDDESTFPLLLLPTELLCHVIYLGLPLADTDWSFTRESVILEAREFLQTLRLVSKLWDSIIISTPQLWNMAYWGTTDWSTVPEIESSDDSTALQQMRKSLAPLRYCIARSGNVPMQIVLDVPGSWVERVLKHGPVRHTILDELWDTLGAASHRVDTLALLSQSSIVFPGGIFGPWIQLRRLYLDNFRWIDGASERVMDYTLCPNLRDVCINCNTAREFEDISFSRSALLALYDRANSSNIRSMKLAGVEYITFASFLRNCDNLQTLTIDSCGCLNSDEALPLNMASVRLDTSIDIRSSNRPYLT